MNKRLIAGWLALLALAVLLAVGGAPLLAQDPQPGSAEANGYEIRWYSFDGGGQMFAGGGSYTLSGAAGQHDAGEMSGGSYHLTGGFWAGAGARLPYRVYLPVVLREY